MPYLTPDSIPEDDDCRPLSIPASSEWLAIVSGALTELTKTWNWAQAGAVTVDEAVARMQLMIDGYYEGCAFDCDVGGGLPPFRLNSAGEIEQLVNGEWVEPTGDYTIPPVPEREEPTEQERLCLAAANAANVLEQLYENVTDSFNEDRTLEEAIGALLALIAIKFFWLAPIAAGLLLLALAAMEIVYLLVEFFGADLWTSEFTDALVCILYACAVDNAGVVTFDYQCVQRGLSTTLEHPDLDAAQLRLLIQISYLLGVIGGVDALNHAGATTEISVADCEGCGRLWCRISDWLVETDGYEVGYPGYCPPYCSEWVFGQGWVPNGGSPEVSNGFHKTFDPIVVTGFRVDWHGSGAVCGGCQISAQLYRSGVAVWTGTSTASVGDGYFLMPPGEEYEADMIVMGGDAGNGSSGFAFTRAEVVYRADEPVLGEDNCP